MEFKHQATNIYIDNHNFSFALCKWPSFLMSKCSLIIHLHIVSQVVEVCGGFMDGTF